MSDILPLAVEIVLLIILSGMVLVLLYLRRRINVERIEYLRQLEDLENKKNYLTDAGLKLLELKEALECEQAKTSKLLRNVLPERVIRDLQEKGESTPERFADVSVLFADIINFTGIAPTMEAADLIVELSDIFSGFDAIFAKYNCERIKTIGDAYMAVAGLPDADENHSRNILLAAVEARDYLQERNRQPGRRQWQMRFGINCGSVVGGIVGRDKYIYDIFGDTVNTASRLEHASEAMKINVSHNVYLKNRDFFEFTPRGMVEVKGKGAVEMYFLEGIKKL